MVTIKEQLVGHRFLLKNIPEVDMPSDGTCLNFIHWKPLMRMVKYCWCGQIHYPIKTKHTVANWKLYFIRQDDAEKRAEAKKYSGEFIPNYQTEHPWRAPVFRGSKIFERV